MDEMNDELMVSLGPRKPRVYDPGDPGVPAERSIRHLVEHPPVDRRVADDSFLELSAACLELRLHEDERLPAWRREPERRRKRDSKRDERHIARDELRSERELRERSRVRPLEHGHARIVANARVKLAVAHIERDHARGATL